MQFKASKHSQGDLVFAGVASMGRCWAAGNAYCFPATSLPRGAVKPPCVVRLHVIRVCRRVGDMGGSGSSAPIPLLGSSMGLLAHAHGAPSIPHPMCSRLCIERHDQFAAHAHLPHPCLTHGLLSYNVLLACGPAVAAWRDPRPPLFTSEGWVAPPPPSLAAGDHTYIRPHYGLASQNNAGGLGWHTHCVRAHYPQDSQP